MAGVKYYRKMKYIDRLTGVPKQRNYNLMEHSYMVGMLFRHFASIEDVPYDINIWDMVFNHDIAECVTQDLPYPVKNFNKITKDSWEAIEEELLQANPALKRYGDKELKESMSPRQYALFKMCDILDLLIFVKEEIDLGNNSKEIKEVERNCFKIINNLEFPFPKIKKYIDEELYGQ